MKHLRSIKESIYSKHEDSSEVRDFFKDKINWRLVTLIDTEITLFEDKEVDIESSVSTQSGNRVIYDIKRGNYVNDRFMKLYKTDYKYEGGLYYNIVSFEDKYGKLNLEQFNSIVDKVKRNFDLKIVHEEDFNIIFQLNEKAGE